eukprot:3133536-Rhodomonas_salina.4
MNKSCRRSVAQGKKSEVAHLAGTQKRERCDLRKTDGRSEDLRKGVRPETRCSPRVGRGGCRSHLSEAAWPGPGAICPENATSWGVAMHQ